MIKACLLFIIIIFLKVTHVSYFQDRSKLGHVMMTVLLGTGALVAMTTVSVVAAVLFTLGHLFVTFFCPALIIRMQPYKKYV